MARYILKLQTRFGGSIESDPTDSIIQAKKTLAYQHGGQGVVWDRLTGRPAE